MSKTITVSTQRNVEGLTNVYIQKKMFALQQQQPPPPNQRLNKKLTVFTSFFSFNFCLVYKFHQY